MRQLKDLGLIIAYELHGFRNSLEAGITVYVLFVEKSNPSKKKLGFGITAAGEE